jgi:hypothetical protein
MSGFSFDGIPTTIALSAPELPEIVPMLYHVGCRVRPARFPASNQEIASLKRFI